MTRDAAGDLRFNGARVFGRGQPVTLDRLPAGPFHRQLAALPAAPRQRALAALQRQCIPEAAFASLQVDRSGHLLYACAPIPPPPPPPVTTPHSTMTLRGTLVPVSASPLIRHSRPGSSKVLYLAFHGPTISGTAWNADSGIASYSCLAWSDDGDRTTFSTAELQTIATIWERIAEDYAPFDIDVTTEQPTAWGATTGEVVFTPTIDANGHALPHDQHGGIAYLDVFGDASYATYSPAWVTAYTGYSASYMAEAAAHEFGHNLGLSHDGTTAPTAEYYTGHEAFTGSGIHWNTIMGGGSFNDISQWSRGEYYHANNPEDDLVKIAAKLAYRSADRGASAGAATPVTTAGSLDFSGDGVIERSAGADWFRFSGVAGTLALDAQTYHSTNGWDYGGDLDLRLELYDAALNPVASDDTVDAFAANLTAVIGSETYYLKVTVPNATVGTPLVASPSGYTTYGVLGGYGFTGRITVAPSGALAVSGNGQAITNGDHQPDASDGSAFGTVVVGASLSHTFTLANNSGQALTIDSLQAFDVPGGTAASSRFTVASAHLPGQLAAGAQSQFTVTYAPGAIFADNAEIVLRSGSDEYGFYVAGTGGAPPPALSAITPDVGLSAGGDAVTLLGSDLLGCVVTFAGVEAAVQVGSATSVTVLSPPHAAGVVAVTVQTAAGIATLDAAFTYQDPPAIALLDPQSGPVGGQTAVQLTGNALSGATLTWDGAALTATVLNDSLLSFTTPAHAAGAVTLTVTTAFGSVTRAAAFTYVDPPLISALDPLTGSDAGGTLVTITGQRLGGAGVTFDGQAAQIVSLTGGQLVVLAPAHAPATVPLVVTTVFGQATADFTYLPLPTVTQVVPAAGPEAGGYQVLFIGTHLSATQATFDGIAAAPTGSSSDTVLRVTAPAHAAGAVTLRLTNGAGPTVLAAGFTYRAVPQIDPGPWWFASTTGGTLVLNGSDLAGATVLIDGVAQTVGGNDGHILTVVVDARPSGAYDLRVTTAGGSVTRVGAVHFSDPPTVSAIAPTAGPVAGGTTVVLTGTQLDDAFVTFDGIPASLLLASDDSLSVTAPAHAAGVITVEVTTAGGAAAAPLDFQYVALPTIADLTPLQGPSAGGTTFSIVGSGLRDAAVLFDGTPATLSATTDLQIVGVTPAHAAGTVAVQVVTLGGTVDASGGFAFRALPTITSVVPNHSPLAGGATITITGTGLASTTLRVAGTAVAAVTTSATQVVVVSPPHAAGTVSLALSTPGGDLATTIDYRDDAPVTAADPSGGGGGGCGLGGGMALLALLALRLRRRD